MTEPTSKRILDAATRVFSRDGFHRARMHAVAAEAGVAVGTIYNHFADKDDLLLSIFEAEFEEQMALLEELRSTDLPVDQQVRRLLEGHFARANERRELSQLVLAERYTRDSRLRERLIDLQRAAVDRIADILRNGMAEGWIRPCNPKVVGQALFDLIQTTSACCFIYEPDEAREMLDSAPAELADLMWRGLRRRDDERTD